jgi:2-dehydro-3-deoxyphosphogluconate aldolase/(4S)-4-hydroxy-2-oxoglutarate aldolase
MVTGGVAPTAENLAEWFRAGVFCVGMGSKLFPRDRVKASDWPYITARCRETLKIIREVV